jgi:hypothetical protein
LKNPVKKSEDLNIICCAKFQKNPMRKIGESYQHRNVFNVSIEKPL